MVQADQKTGKVGSKSGCVTKYALGKTPFKNCAIACGDKGFSTFQPAGGATPGSCGSDGVNVGVCGIVRVEKVKDISDEQYEEIKRKALAYHEEANLLDKDPAPSRDALRRLEEKQLDLSNFTFQFEAPSLTRIYIRELERLYNQAISESKRGTAASIKAQLCARKALRYCDLGS